MTPPWLTVVGLTALAGASIPLGACVPHVERIRPEWLETEFRHSLIAFGGGALLSAVALVLVPQGARELSTGPIIVWFSLGGFLFFALDLSLSRRKTSASQLTAMLADFLPEAIALGAVIASGNKGALLLGLLIALQNLPESFNAYRELRATTGASPSRILVTFAGIALLGPAAGLAGYFWLSDAADAVAALMLAASGGILYLVFQDVAPQARLDRHWAPSLGAVAGFLMGIIGHSLLMGS